MAQNCPNPSSFIDLTEEIESESKKEDNVDEPQVLQNSTIQQKCAKVDERTVGKILKPSPKQIREKKFPVTSPSSNKQDDDEVIIICDLDETAPVLTNQPASDDNSINSPEIISPKQRIVCTVKPQIKTYQKKTSNLQADAAANETNDDDIIIIPDDEGNIETNNDVLKQDMIKKINNFLKTKQKKTEILERINTAIRAVSRNWEGTPYLQKLTPEQVKALKKSGLTFRRQPKNVKIVETPKPINSTVNKSKTFLPIDELNDLSNKPKIKISQEPASSSKRKKSCEPNIRSNPTDLVDPLETILLKPPPVSTTPANTQQETDEAVTHLNALNISKPIEVRSNLVQNAQEDKSNAFADIMETASAVATISTPFDKPAENSKTEENPIVYLLCPLDPKTGTPLTIFKQGQVNQVLALVPTNSHLAGPTVSVTPNEKNQLQFSKLIEDLEIESPALVKPVDIKKILHKRKPPEGVQIEGRCKYRSLGIDDVSYFKGFTTRQRVAPTCLKSMRDLIREEKAKIKKLVKCVRSKPRVNFVSCGKVSDFFLSENIKTEEIIIEDDELEIVKKEKDEDEAIFVEDESANFEDITQLEIDQLPTLAEVVAKVNTEISKITQPNNSTSKTQEALGLIKRALDLMQSVSSTNDKVQEDQVTRSVPNSQVEDASVSKKRAPLKRVANKRNNTIPETEKAKVRRIPGKCNNVVAEASSDEDDLLIVKRVHILKNKGTDDKVKGRKRKKLI